MSNAVIRCTHAGGYGSVFFSDRIDRWLDESALPWLLGGAADLAPSTKTHLSFEFAGEFQPSGSGEYKGRNFHFGVREHAMCAIANGIISLPCVRCRE